MTGITQYKYLDRSRIYRRPICGRLCPGRNWRGYCAELRRFIIAQLASESRATWGRVSASSS